ncbi:uncharacterized protein LOC124256103 [Haliotis rubra]|uniref:uncharacterized protein LOC124256103 n=1 Tax=Haliotis rubra TaxID=36100 RepID=UPI001EE5726D|nr:uncharacterized protein LOC124256103 [Haliotis rubra]
MVVVDDKGRQHIRRFQFCKCELEPITLIKFNLWPASPKHPKLAFHTDLLRWIHGLSVECHVSVKGFCEALSARLPKQHQGFVSLEVKSIYKVLMKETLEEFRYFLYNMNHLHQFHPQLSNGAECAACYKLPTKIISLDADFQLVRKVSSGYSWGKSKHTTFFLEQEEVDEYMKSYSGDSKKT